MSVAWVGAGIAAVGAISGMENSRRAGNQADMANATNQESIQLSRDQLDWEKQKYAEDAPTRAAAEKRAQEVSDASLASMNYAMNQAKDSEAYNKGTFRPLEQQLVSGAQTYDTPGRRNQEAGAAVAEVNRQVGAQRLATAQELAQSGVSPESGKAQALASMVDVGAAKAAAGADYTARKNVEQQGYARMADAAALGRNLPSQQATQQQISTTAGNASVGAAMSGLGATQVGVGQLASGYQTAINGLTSGTTNLVSMSKLFNGAANDASGAVSSGMDLFSKYYKPGGG